MYEQDYIMRMNRDIIRTISRLVFNKDTEFPLDITSQTLKNEDKKMLNSLQGQVNIGKINEVEKEICQSVGNNESRALEKALLFYAYLNEQTDEFLLANSFSRERIQSGLQYIASQLGILDIVNLNYFE